MLIGTVNSGATMLADLDLLLTAKFAAADDLLPLIPHQHGGPGRLADTGG